MAELRARFIALVSSPDGAQADLAIVEPNGDEHMVRCLCRFSGVTEIGADGSDTLEYLNERYGSSAVLELCRDLTLSAG